MSSRLKSKYDHKKVAKRVLRNVIRAIKSDAIKEEIRYQTLASLGGIEDELANAGLDADEVIERISDEVHDHIVGFIVAGYEVYKVGMGR